MVILILAFLTVRTAIVLFAEMRRQILTIITAIVLFAEIGALLWDLVSIWPTYGVVRTS